MEITWQTPPHASQKQDYVLYSGNSHVLPYYFEFVSHVNKRWEGKTIVDLFSQDFRGRSRDIMLVLSNVDGYKWMERMYLFPTLLNDPRRLATSYTVMGWDVEILQSEPDVLTVCEPASVPVSLCQVYPIQLY
ncbi:Detected protein of confused Function [Hibiscus syriacus]|uniref:Detected protein of confused Function n=1 Tax=Hibiscus syriacus TaxID=106335 RepID=A0A6A3AM70_HIBSY|nr:Detected protein of confused Function [Hibiscus syriacus]